MNVRRFIIPKSFEFFGLFVCPLSFENEMYFNWIRLRWYASYTIYHSAFTNQIHHDNILWQVFSIKISTYEWLIVEIFGHCFNELIRRNRWLLILMIITLKLVFGFEIQIILEVKIISRWRMTMKINQVSAILSSQIMKNLFHHQRGPLFEPSSIKWLTSQHVIFSVINLHTISPHLNTYPHTSYVKLMFGGRIAWDMRNVYPS